MNQMAPQRVAITDRWITRPADETYPCLDTLFQATYQMADNSFASVHDVRKIQVITDPALTRPESMTALGLALPGGNVTMATNWSFGQMCSLISCPAGHYRTLPAPIASYGLQYKLNTYQGELVKAYTDLRDNTLRALTSPTYGRVEDYKLVDAVRQIAGNGIGDTEWVAAHMLKGLHPAAFYASDRDMFCFLVDREHPIEFRNPATGRLERLYRGFFVWNSEVGSRSLGITTFLFRDYCDNRLIYSSSGVEQVIIRHTKGAPERFLEAAGPALRTYANSESRQLVSGIQAAMTKTLARSDEEAIALLNERTDFSKAAAKAAIEQHAIEEGHPVRSAWDMAQAITAFARAVPHQDDRVGVERQAIKFLTAA